MSDVAKPGDALLAIAEHVHRGIRNQVPHKPDEFLFQVMAIVTGMFAADFRFPEMPADEVGTSCATFFVAGAFHRRKQRAIEEIKTCGGTA